MICLLLQLYESLYFVMIWLCIFVWRNYFLSRLQISLFLYFLLCSCQPARATCMVTFHSSIPGRSQLSRGWPEPRPHPPAYLLRKLVVCTLSVVLDTSTSMAESDNWVFDSLVGFLRGPVWNVPILTFIEHKSLGKEG